MHITFRQPRKWAPAGYSWCQHLVGCGETLAATAHPLQVHDMYDPEGTGGGADPADVPAPRYDVLLGLLY